MGQRTQRRNVGILAAAGAGLFAIASLAPVSAQNGGGLSIPVLAAGQPGSPGVLRITEFALQDERTAVAIGTLSLSAAGGDGHRTVVTKVAVPIISVASSAVRAAVAGAAAGGGTPASGLTGTTSGTGQGGTGLAAAPTPGQLATCGALRVALGPMSVARQGLTVNVPRLDIDIDAGPETAAASTGSQARSLLESAICSASAALAESDQATGGFATAVVSGATTATPAGTTGGATASGVGSGTGTGQPTPLQNLVTALNAVLRAL